MGTGDQLNGKTIAILATDGFEQSELFEPLEALKKAGADVKIVSLKSGQIKAWDKTDWGKKIAVDLVVADADASEFDALVLPGGVINPDKLRMDEDAMDFVRAFDQAGKTIAAICHGPWSLIEAELVEGKKVTSWPSLKTDLRNAGAEWVDKECSVDGNLITSRKPEDIPAFNKAIISAVQKGATNQQMGLREDSSAHTHH